MKTETVETYQIKPSGFPDLDSLHRIRRALVTEFIACNITIEADKRIMDVINAEIDAACKRASA